MFNEGKLDSIITEYKKQFIQSQWLKEKFKWEAVKCFQDNWDISTDNFTEMFKKSLVKTENLLSSKNNFPKDTIINLAKLYPNEAWVGIEKDVSAGAVAARHAIEEENPLLENKRFIIANAEQLQEWFATGEVDVIHLNFSDPWPKKGNHKRRLSSAKFLGMYRDILTVWLNFILMKRG